MFKNRRLFNRTSQSRIIHPQSRIVDQMKREMRHNIRQAEVVSKNSQIAQRTFNRFMWFREQLEAHAYVTGFPASHPPEAWLQAMTAAFIDRNVETLRELRASRNPPRGEIRALEALREAELAEFNSSKGFEVPDVTTAVNFEYFLSVWDQSFVGSRKIPRRKITRDSAADVPPFTPATIVSDADDDDEVESEQASADNDENKGPPGSRRQRRLFRAVKKQRLVRGGDRKGAKASSGGIQIAHATSTRLRAAERQRALRRQRQLAQSRALL